LLPVCLLCLLPCLLTFLFETLLNAVVGDGRGFRCRTLNTESAATLLKTTLSLLLKKRLALVRSHARQGLCLGGGRGRRRRGRRRRWGRLRRRRWAGGNWSVPAVAIAVVVAVAVVAATMVIPSVPVIRAVAVTVIAVTAVPIVIAVAVVMAAAVAIVAVTRPVALAVVIAVTRTVSAVAIAVVIGAPEPVMVAVTRTVTVVILPVDVVALVPCTNTSPRFHALFLFTALLPALQLRELFVHQVEHLTLKFPSFLVLLHCRATLGNVLDVLLDTADTVLNVVNLFLDDVVLLGLACALLVVLIEHG
jgi:hypothetical protein